MHVCFSCSQAGLVWGRICRQSQETSNGRRNLGTASLPTGVTSASWPACTDASDINSVRSDLSDLYIFSLYTVKKSHSHLPLYLPLRSLGCAEAEDVFRKCERVLEILDHHDEELFSEWTEGLEEICQTHLKEPLLTLDLDTGLFQVNFSPAVSTKQVSNIFRFALKVKEKNQGNCCD